MEEFEVQEEGTVSQKMARNISGVAFIQILDLNHLSS